MKKKKLLLYSFNWWSFIGVWSLLRSPGTLFTITANLLLLTPLELFTSALADGFSLEFEWQQVSSSLQDSSQYSGHFIIFILLLAQFLTPALADGLLLESEWQQVSSIFLDSSPYSSQS